MMKTNLAGKATAKVDTDADHPRLLCPRRKRPRQCIADHAKNFSPPHAHTHRRKAGSVRLSRVLW
jgi:hypothetical protein